MTRSPAVCCTGRSWGGPYLLLALMMFLAGCGPAGPERAPTAVPTRTPVPTYTPTPVAASAPTMAAPTTPPDAPTATMVVLAAPADTPAPSPSPLAPQLTVTGALVNVRSGPDTSFDLVGAVAAGETFAVVARSAAGDWWQVCCFAGQNGWIFGELATVTNADSAGVAADQPTAVAAVTAPTDAPVVTMPQELSTPTSQAPAPVAAPYDPNASSAGNFDPTAQYQIAHFKVLGLDENNGGIRDSSAQHHIFLTVLDQNGAGVDGAVVRNLVGDKSEVVTGGKGPGKAEIAMYYEPFKLAVVSDPAGPVTSQVSNQMGLIFPHLPDIVGKLGDVNYEYGACPTIDLKCIWPLSDVNFLHFSYEITFQKVR